MKRSTLSILASAAILIVGIALIWSLIIAPRLKTSAPSPSPTPAPAATGAEEMHGALNLYLTAPDAMPAGVSRAELTLIKAALVDGKGGQKPFFDGVQRVMLQSGSVEKVLSEIIPNGSWSGLKLEFSPAATLSMSDGTTEAALVENRSATLTFQADVPVSHSLDLFARVPLSPDLKKADTTVLADIAPDPIAAESYVFGSYILDQRGRSNVWNLPHLSLSEVIKADLGLDITASLPGSNGFNPAELPPTTKPQP